MPELSYMELSLRHDVQERIQKLAEDGFRFWTTYKACQRRGIDYYSDDPYHPFYPFHRACESLVAKLDELNVFLLAVYGELSNRHEFLRRKVIKLDLTAVQIRAKSSTSVSPEDFNELRRLWRNARRAIDMVKDGIFVPGKSAMTFSMYSIDLY